MKLRKSALRLKKKTYAIIVAAALNIVLITMLALYLASGAQQPLLAILLPAAVHISLCGTLLFFYASRDNDGY